MIKINRSRVGCPEILSPPPSSTSSAYKRAEVRRALYEMQHGKCCYCERQLGDSRIYESEGADRHVEHFRPKNENGFPELTNEWSNLLLGCGQCNIHKGVKFPQDGEGPLLIDPSNPDIEPEDHIEFYVDYRNDGALFGQIRPRKKSKHGEATIEATNLRDNFHSKERKRIIRKLLEHEFDIKHADTDEQRVASLNMIKSLAQDNAEYAGVVRCFARTNDLVL